MAGVEEAQQGYDHAVQQELFAERAYEVAVENVAYWALQLEIARRREALDYANITEV